MSNKNTVVPRLKEKNTVVLVPCDRGRWLQDTTPWPPPSELFSRSSPCGGGKRWILTERFWDENMCFNLFKTRQGKHTFLNKGHPTNLKNRESRKRLGLWRRRSSVRSTRSHPSAWRFHLQKVSGQLRIHRSTFECHGDILLLIVGDTPLTLTL